MRFLPRWAAPLAFLTAAIVVGVHAATSGAAMDPATLMPRVEVTVPSVTLAGVIGIASAAFGALVVLAPAGVIPAVAGLALLGTLASSLQAALAQPDERIPAVVVFATAASGTTIAGVSAAF